MIKRQRSVCAYFPKYNNKSLYIFLMELFLKENNTPQLRTALTELVSELCLNIQISKEVYEFIFQKPIKREYLIQIIFHVLEIILSI